MRSRYEVAVMHDFFIDRLVHMDPLRFAKLVTEKAGQGGGGLHGIQQEEIRGGNAVNLAHALARLGVRTLLITHSDPASESILRGAFAGLPADLRVKPLKAGLTVALEGSVNVMLGDRGGAADFGPERLQADEWNALGKAKVVCCVNWAGNDKGTELLAAIRENVGPGPKIFFDPADFRDRLSEFRTLLRLISRKHLVDWISMSEGEARAAAGAIGLRTSDLDDTCRKLADRLHVAFDLHAEGSSYRSDGKRVVKAAATRVRPRRLTGAGDVWNAASIYARLQEWDDRTALGFANAAARLYLENPAPVPPALGKVLEILR